jgi:hypothetical protein
VITSRPVPRQNLRPAADVTVVGLAFTIALSGADIFLDVARDWPGGLAGVWLIFTLGAGVPFLFWFSAARANTATYGPGRIRRYRDWTLAGWVCLVAGLWVPYVISAEILRASARPTAGTADAEHAPRAMVTVVRVWWALWLGSWLAWWCFVGDYGINSSSHLGVTTSQRLLCLAADLLSIGAAGCAIAVITIITRLQASRAAEQAFLPDTSPDGREARVLLLTGVPLVPAVLVILFGIATSGFLLTPADLLPTPSEVLGTWRASDGGTLVFYPDGLFSASGLSVDPLTGITVSTPWSGSGDWTISAGACDGSAPGVCLTTDPPVSSEDGWTEGSPASLRMVLPAAPAGQTYDTGYNDDFSKL